MEVREIQSDLKIPRMEEGLMAQAQDIWISNFLDGIVLLSQVYIILLQIAVWYNFPIFVGMLVWEVLVLLLGHLHLLVIGEPANLRVVVLQMTKHYAVSNNYKYCFQYSRVHSLINSRHILIKSVRHSKIKVHRFYL